MTEQEGFIAAIAERDSIIKLLIDKRNEYASLDEQRLASLKAIEGERNFYAAQLETARYELDAIPAIKEERDAYAKAADDMAAEHKVERDALRDAARLALDALHAVLHDCDDIDMVESNEPGRDIGPWQLSNEAIVVLKAVL